MNSSGIKRGLAIAAVSALAVTGLPSLASAAPLATTGDAVTFYSQTSGNGSTQNDGVNQTVHLLASAGDVVDTVRFQYRISGGAAHTIKTVSRANGVFSAEWDPTPIAGAVNVTIEAAGLNTNGDPAGGAIPSKPVVLGAASAAVDIANAPGSEVGAFKQPYSGANNKLLGTVSGTTSGGGTPGISTFGLLGTTTADVIDGNSFSSIVNLSGYTLTTPADDEAVIIATAGSEDAEAVTLYKQDITSITAEPTPEFVAGGPGTQGDVTVTVLDQKGKPIAGARVAGPQGFFGATSTKYTNSKGEALFTGVIATTAGADYSYHVDTDIQTGYQSNKDLEKTATVTRYAPTLETLEASSADGAAFDVDENATGDITVTGKDQHDGNITASGVRGTWTIEPFDTSLPTTTNPATIAGSTNVALPTGEPDGTYTLNTYIDKDGVLGQGPGDLSADPLVLTVGQAEITWDNAAANAQVQAGTATTQQGLIALSDGTVLGGRTAEVLYTPGGAGNAKFSPTQPTGTVLVNGTHTTVTSAADGTFSVSVSDPAATPQPSERGGELDATSAALNVSSADSTPDQVIDFIELTADSVDIGNRADLVDGEATPGRPVSYTVVVKNADGDLLQNKAVDLSLDSGFFTTYAASDADLESDAAPVEGGIFGVWKDLGATQTLTTDADGEVDVTVAIGRDTGFDDDGQVDAELSATADAATDDETTTFESTDPLNPGTATVEIPAGQGASMPFRQLLAGPPSNDVSLKVFVTDQFGNLTDQNIDLSDNTSDADVADLNGGGATSTSGVFTDDPANLEASEADVAVDQTIKVDWTDADTNQWTDDDPALPGFQALRDQGTAAGSTSSDTKTINWYAINYLTSTFTFTSDAVGNQVPGKTVNVAYTAIDQHGNPIANTDVKLFRTGPDDLQDGETKIASTDNDGVARYVFQGTKEGTATVTALITDWKSPNPVPSTTKSLKVVFANATAPVVVVPVVPVAPPAPAPVAAPSVTLRTIAAKLFGSSNAAKADKITINAPSSAKGAKVKLYKLVNGKRKGVATGTLNSRGDKTFTVRDANGTKNTKYVAVVQSTKTTKGDVTNSKSVK